MITIQIDEDSADLLLFGAFLEGRLSCLDCVNGILELSHLIPLLLKLGFKLSTAIAELLVEVLHRAAF